MNTTSNTNFSKDETCTTSKNYQPIIVNPIVIDNLFLNAKPPDNYTSKNQIAKTRSKSKKIIMLVYIISFKY